MSWSAESLLRENANTGWQRAANEGNDDGRAY